MQKCRRECLIGSYKRVTVGSALKGARLELWVKDKRYREDGKIDLCGVDTIEMAILDKQGRILKSVTIISNINIEYPDHDIMALSMGSGSDSRGIEVRVSRRLYSSETIERINCMLSESSNPIKTARKMFIDKSPADRNRITEELARELTEKDLKEAIRKILEI